MTEHPINGLMLTAMNSIKDMIDVNTIIGDPIQASNNIVVIPVSKVSFGFAAGGSEFNIENESNEKLPFGGGAGAGVSLSPVAFLVIKEDGVKLVQVSHATPLDKLLDYVPDLFEKVNYTASKYMQNKKEQTDKNISEIQNRTDKNNEKEDTKSNKTYENDKNTKVEIKKDIKIED